MSGSWKRLEEELLCPICLSLFAEPVQLPCAHNFCKGCISPWVEGKAAVRCPECNRGYERLPPLEVNVKLARLSERFGALDAERLAAAEAQVPAGRADPPAPPPPPPPPPAAQRLCSRCNEPRADAEEEPGAWTNCPIHERNRVSMCRSCCVSECSTGCKVERQRQHMKDMLLRQQERLVGEIKNVDQQLTKLEAKKKQAKGSMSELELRVAAQYQRMHRLLDLNHAETMLAQESGYSKYERNHNQKVRELVESRQESEKYLDSVKTLIKDSDNINFVKDIDQYHMLMYRSGCHLIGAKPQPGPYAANPELPTKETDLHRVLRNGLRSVVLETWTRSGLQRRTHSEAFSGGDAENSSTSHKRSLPDQSHPSGTYYPPPPPDVPGNRRCSTARARPLFPALDSFPSVTSLGFPAQAPGPSSQPLQRLPAVGLTEAPRTVGLPDFFQRLSQPRNLAATSDPA